uniref:Uncharacterized protein n=1 Tax=Timema cristinae TaxID=61476 RepID=A0A7R9H8J5_TIMCR|nr:unnamed protein product [Timema cristinae]
MCKKDLLMLDFESILKYFRVSLPKKCRNEEVARQLMRIATSLKVKKLKKYEHEFAALKGELSPVSFVRYRINPGTDYEAQDSADQYSSELERLKSTLLRAEEEKRRLEEEAVQIKEMLKREVNRAETESSRNAAIIAEYKQICHRLDNEQGTAKAALNQLRSQIISCSQCCDLLGTKGVTTTDYHPLGDGEVPLQGCGDGDPQLVRAQERIRELELELAQTKLAHVEAECRNQDLVHQLHAAAAELQVAKNSWPPWLHKTLSSIKEVANKKELVSTAAAAAPQPQLRRDSAPTTTGLARDSHSRENLRGMVDTGTT